MFSTKGKPILSETKHRTHDIVRNKALLLNLNEDRLLSNVVTQNKTKSICFLLRVKSRVYLIGSFGATSENSTKVSAKQTERSSVAYGF